MRTSHPAVHVSTSTGSTLPPICWSRSQLPVQQPFLFSVRCIIRYFHIDMMAMSLTTLAPRTWYFWSIVLQHSFYFYFYFEHLNFTWSYLIDTKISWSLDLISWSYLGDLISWSVILSWSLDLIIWWWSKICFFIWTLHYYLHAFNMPLTHVFHWWLTCILHMLLCNMLLPYTWHALDTRFTCVYLEDNTWTLVYNCS